MLKLPVRLNTQAGFSGLREQTPSEVQSLVVKRTLEKFANAGSSAVDFQTGHIHVNGVHAALSGISGGTVIGQFLDTTRNSSPGAVDAGIATTTYDFKQKLDAVAETGVYHPLVIESGTGTIREMTTVEFNSMISDVMAEMVAGGPGSYYLNPSAPPSGTWVSVADVVNIANTTANNTTTLWKCITGVGAANTDNRPMRLDTSSPTEIALRAMSDADLEKFALRVQNKIVNDGIGQYRLQFDSPAGALGGSWVQMGGDFADTRHVATPQSFTSSYTGVYQGSFTAPYTGSYGGSYGSASTGSYTGEFAGGYVGSYAGDYIGSYGVPYTGAYAGSYNQVFTGAYAGSYTGGFTGAYAGAYATVYSGLTPKSYQGTFSGSYQGSFTGSYQGTYSGVYAGAYLGGYLGSYAGYYAGGYLGAMPVYYAGWYAGSYGGSYTGERYYTGIVGPFYQMFYYEPLEPQYFSSSGSYVGYYVGYYWGSRLHWNPTYFVGYYLGYYAGWYQGWYTGNYGGSYVGNYAGSYQQAFSGSYAQMFTGLYARESMGFFTGSYAGTYSRAFTGSYIGGYTGQFSGSYTGTYGAGFTGSYTGLYSGTYTGSYAGSYTGTYGQIFTGNYGGGYTGVFNSSFTGQYTRQSTAVIVQPTFETISTVRLWLRTA
jgi:hypothetical protein